MQEQQVILVNENDESIGTMEKLKVHQQGLLHRAFSVFVFDKDGKMLLQQRSAEKYHGANLWSNTCCSHPFPNEASEQAAKRRLQEEMGFQTSLNKIFHFTYKAEVENNLVEHEFDHVFAGEYDGEININKAEVASFAYKSLPEIKKDIDQYPEKFTSWFKIVFPKIEQWWKEQYNHENNHQSVNKL